MQFRYANISELNHGVSMHELCAAESLASYIKANPKEKMFKTEKEFSEILSLDPKTEEDNDALNYAVNVCRRLFPHQVKMID